MASNKSQLDVYRIDTQTVFNDMISSCTEEENEQLQNLLNEFNESETKLSSTVSSYVSKVIEHILKTHNNKKNTLSYVKKDLSNPIIDDYAMKLYEGKSKPTSPIYVLLDDRVSRTSATGISYSHVLFVYNKDNIFVFCSGAGWQVVSPYVDSLFGLQILSRLIPENAAAINSVKFRGYSGTVSGQETNFRKRARASEIIEFGQLFKDMSGSIEKTTIKDSLGIELSPKRKSIGANFKNSFKLKKRLTLAEFSCLLQKITKLLEIEPYFSIEDWLGLSSLGKTKKDKKTITELFDKVFTLISNKATDDSIQVDAFICNPNLSSYMVANKYKLTYDDCEFEQDEIYDVDALLPYVKQLQSKFDRDTNTQEKVIKALSETDLESFIDGETYADTSSKLKKCLQICILHEGKNYILVDGEWYVVYEGLEKKLNRELPGLIKGRISAFALPNWDKNLPEDDYLNVLTSSPYNHAKLHRKRPLDNIELCDTMFLNGKTLVLCHFKDGFDTSMRVLTSQVRSSVELIIDIKMNDRIEELASSWIKYKDEKNIPDFEVIKKAILGLDGYSVEECIVFNPKDEIIKTMDTNDSVIAKYELSLLIKRWGFDIPLTISFPETV